LRGAKERFSDCDDRDGRAAKDGFLDCAGVDSESFDCDGPDLNGCSLKGRSDESRSEEKRSRDERSANGGFPDRGAKAGLPEFLEPELLENDGFREKEGLVARGTNEGFSNCGGFGDRGEKAGFPGRTGLAERLSAKRVSDERLPAGRVSKIRFPDCAAFGELGGLVVASFVAGFATRGGM
jgi:hypothetical protein